MAQIWNSKRSYAALTLDVSAVTKTTPTMASTGKEAPTSVWDPAVVHSQKVDPSPITQPSLSVAEFVTTPTSASKATEPGKYTSNRDRIRSSIRTDYMKNKTENVREPQSVSAQKTQHPSVRIIVDRNGWELAGKRGFNLTRQQLVHSTIMTKANAENKFGVPELTKLDGLGEESFTTLAMHLLWKENKCTCKAKRGQKARTIPQTLGKKSYKKALTLTRQLKNHLAGKETIA